MQVKDVISCRMRPLISDLLNFKSFSEQNLKNYFSPPQSSKIIKQKIKSNSSFSDFIVVIRRRISQNHVVTPSHNNLHCFLILFYIYLKCLYIWAGSLRAKWERKQFHHYPAKMLDLNAWHVPRFFCSRAHS